MRRKTREYDEVAFQMGPMIDMTFLLLIFFMVTTKISKEQIKLDVKLPTASSAIIPKDLTDRDTINIDDKGIFWLRDRQLADAELTVYLKQRFKDYPPLRLYVRADAQTSAKRIKELMKIASEAGAIDVIFGSYQKAQ